MQSPSNLQIGYMNSHIVADCMKFPEVKMWNLPITHNKSSNRWRNVGHLSPVKVQCMSSSHGTGQHTALSILA